MVRRASGGTFLRLETHWFKHLHWFRPGSMQDCEVELFPAHECALDVRLRKGVSASLIPSIPDVALCTRVRNLCTVFTLESSRSNINTQEPKEENLLRSHATFRCRLLTSLSHLRNKQRLASLSSSHFSIERPPHGY